jgi:nucleotide-binding universal stress UspA family protein
MVTQQEIATRSSDPELLPHARRGKIRTVLLATDLSPISDAATIQAIDLTWSLGARLLVVNVIDVGEHANGALSPYSSSTRIDQKRAERERPLMAIVDEARSRGIEAVFLLWNGEAGHSIVAAAEAERADLVVVGTRGLDRADRVLLGSVSDYVVYHCPCPVLVAR